MIDLIAPVQAKESIRCPLFASAIPAGFPSPAEDYIDRSLDLNELLIRHPTATFFVRVKGQSMTGAGIHDGDILIVDRSITPTDGKVIIAVVDGELTVKRLRKHQGKLWLIAENEDFDPIEINGQREVSAWGVVTNVIHSL